jgi:high-affinity iron transporter
MLIVVAAGILAYGVHELQEAGLLPGDDAKAFDISSWYDQSAWYAAVLKGLFSFSAKKSFLEVGAWLAYVGTVLTLFLKAPKPTTPPPDVPVAAVEESPKATQSI